MQIIIVRHGETVDNVNWIIQGQSNGQLTDIGREQAKKLGERLKNEKIDFIYSSDLTRTKDTIKEVLKHHKKIPVIYDPLLRERSFGIYEGKPFKELYSDVDKDNKDFYYPEKGETLKDIRKRVIAFMKKIRKAHQDDETILLCTHGGWKHAFIGYFLGIPANSKIQKKFWFGNTSVSIFDFNQKSNRIHLLNCTKHLDE